MNELINIDNLDVSAIFNRREGIFSFVCNEEIDYANVAPKENALTLELIRDRELQAWKIIEKDIVFKAANKTFIGQYNRAISAASYAMLRLNAAQQSPADLVKTSGPSTPPGSGSGLEGFWKSFGL